MKHMLSPLLYDYAALEAHIDAQPVVNWEEAARRFERSDHSAEQDWESEGGSLLTVTT